MSRYKYGVIPHDYSKPAPMLSAYTTSDPLPNTPSIVDRESKVTSWPMYLNDQIGCCTVAGMFHSISSMTAYSGNTPGGVTFADDEVVKVYSAVTSPPYDPASGANDNGAELSTVCRYMMQTGADDTEGKTHRLAAWALIDDPTDLLLLKRVANAFGAVYLAINCPESAENQNAARLPWVPITGSPIVGGHCIDLQVSSVNSGLFDDETVITWGSEQKMNEAFARKYIVQAVAVVSEDYVNAYTGKNPVGLDLEAMVTDCQSKYLV